MCPPAFLAAFELVSELHIATLLRHHESHLCCVVRRHITDRQGLMKAAGDRDQRVLGPVADTQTESTPPVHRSIDCVAVSQRGSEQWRLAGLSRCAV